MKYTHLSSRSELSPQYRYSQDTEAPKPAGLWLSVEGESSWEDWCREESFSDARSYTHKFHIELKETANILTITNKEQLDDFSRNYGRAPIPGFTWINWSKVSEKYDGIVIAPWIGGYGDPRHWYSGWDIASAAVWNLGAIKTMVLDPSWKNPLIKAKVKAEKPSTSFPLATPTLDGAAVRAGAGLGADSSRFFISSLTSHVLSGSSVTSADTAAALGDGEEKPGERLSPTNPSSA